MTTCLTIGQELRYRGKRVFVKGLHLAAIILLDECGDEVVAGYSDPDLTDPVQEVIRKLDRR